MFKTVSECINFLESQKRHTKGIDEMKVLCEMFSHPERDLNSVHIAGTNGKGSVAAYVTSILVESGIKVGTFTSPFVENFNDRIRINNLNIEDDNLIHYTNLVYKRIKGRKFGFFSLITLIMLLYFNDRKVDVAIIETGIGGTYDSTNILTSKIAVVTNVTKDHMDILGNDYNKIASNKLGILDEGATLIMKYQENLKKLVDEKVKEKNAVLRYVISENVDSITTGLKQTTFDYASTRHMDFKNMVLSMLGRYQSENAAMAIEVGLELQRLGYGITYESIYRGLKNTKWVGRLEILSTNPLVIVDGAHNEDGIKNLCEFVKGIRGRKKVRVFLAISKTKDRKAMIDRITRIADEIVFSEFKSDRSSKAMELYDMCSHSNKSIEIDIQKISERVLKDNCINIIAGSLYFVSAFRNKLIKND